MFNTLNTIGRWTLKVFGYYKLQNNNQGVIDYCDHNPHLAYHSWKFRRKVIVNIKVLWSTKFQVLYSANLVDNLENLADVNSTWRISTKYKKIYIKIQSRQAWSNVNSASHRRLWQWTSFQKNHEICRLSQYPSHVTCNIRPIVSLRSTSEYPDLLIKNSFLPTLAFENSGYDVHGLKF